MPALAVVKFAPKSGLPKDSIVNTFAFDVPSPLTAADVGDIEVNLYSFYDTLSVGSTTPISAFLSDHISRVGAPMNIKVYDIAGHLDGSPHGSPHPDEGNFPLGAPAGAALPSEVCCVMTIEATGRPAQPVEVPDNADPGTEVQRPRQRYTGRISIGPVTLNAQEAGLPQGGSIPAAAFTLSIRQAAIELKAAMPSWSVWSRSDASLRPVDFVSTDDAWDTQRRRGTGPTLRTRTNV